MAQEILRTSDVIEVSDEKILTSDSIAEFGTPARTSLSTVLSQIEDRLPTLSERSALSTLTSPSAENPVVLLRDIPAYVSEHDLGEIKDAVETFGDLPPSGDPLITNGIGDLRPVLSDKVIYRWDGIVWAPFISTGTLQHSQLSNFNVDLAYQHLTTDETSRLHDNIHEHTNLIDNVFDMGSGKIISEEERALLPNLDEKSALGNAGSLYVTHLDPRMRTVKNPYTTVGPSGTFDGVDVDTFRAALSFIASSPTVKTLELFPATFILNDIIPWLSASELRLECLTEARLHFNTFNFEISGTGGLVYLRGLTFVNGGLLVDRPGTVIENCRFEREVIVNAPCSFRSCTFNGLTLNARTTIDTCILLGSLTTIDSDYCQIIASELSDVVISDVYDVTLSNNFIFGSITDGGKNTRILGNRPLEVNQPYIGRQRTVGRIGSYADFCSNGQYAFLAALNDPDTKEIEILGGTYVFSAPVLIPAGVTIRACANVILNGACFIVSGDDVQFIGISFTALDASPIKSLAAVNNIVIESCSFNVSGASPAIDLMGNQITATRCEFRGTTGVFLTGDYYKISHCSFYSGHSLTTTSDYFYLGDCLFDSAAPAINGNNGIVRGNIFRINIPAKSGTSNTLWVGNFPPLANNTKGVDELALSFSEHLMPVSDAVSRSELLGSAVLGFQETGTAETISLPIPLGVLLNRTAPFTVRIDWTAIVFSGAAVWEITATFRDRVGQEIGASSTTAAVSTRTNLRPQDEESLTVSISDYGFPLGVMPTHLGLRIKRLGDTPEDTLMGIAYITQVEVRLPIY